MGQIHGRQTPDLIQQLDSLVEDADDTRLPHLLNQEIALEAYLNEPHALTPGERDTQGLDVTECSPE